MTVFMSAVMFLQVVYTSAFIVLQIGFAWLANFILWVRDCGNGFRNVVGSWIDWFKSDDETAGLILIIPELVGYAYFAVWLVVYIKESKFAPFIVLPTIVGLLLFVVCTTCNWAINNRNGTLVNRPFGRWAQTLSAITIFALTLTIDLVKWEYYYVLGLTLTLALFSRITVMRIADDLGFFIFLYRTTATTALAAATATSSCPCHPSYSPKLSPASFSTAYGGRIFIPVMMIVLGVLYIWLRPQPTPQLPPATATDPAPAPHDRVD